MPKITRSHVRRQPARAESAICGYPASDAEPAMHRVFLKSLELSTCENCFRNTITAKLENGKEIIFRNCISIDSVLHGDNDDDVIIVVPGEFRHICHAGRRSDIGMYGGHSAHME